MQSMTGFARIDGADDAASWTIEAKSVNAKGLDVRVRAPHGYDGVDAALRTSAKKYLARGTVHISIALTPIKSSDNAVQIDTDILSAYLSAYKEMDAETSAPSFDGLLRLPGVIKPGDGLESDDVIAARLTAMTKDADSLMKALKQSRSNEGAALKTVLIDQLAEITKLVEQARAIAGATQDILESRLERGLEALGNRAKDFDEARLHQEVALLIVKADITEELDRLNGHINAAQDLLQSDKPVGRKFDFLMQEFNREANTLCSKAVDQSLTAIGLDLKTIIDQMKEQIQNVE